MIKWDNSCKMLIIVFDSEKIVNKCCLLLLINISSTGKISTFSKSSEGNI